MVAFGCLAAGMLILLVMKKREIHALPLVLSLLLIVFGVVLGLS